MNTTISITEEIKKKLDTLKIHSRETYNDVMERILNIEKNGCGANEGRNNSGNM